VANREFFLITMKVSTTCLTDRKFLGLLGQLFGEPATLFKDKINYKLPGGTGFKAHQDAQGGWGEYGVSYHISSLVTIDHAFKENGCLELAKGQHKNGLMGELWNELPDDVIEKLKFDVVETHLGDVIFFWILYSPPIRRQPYRQVKKSVIFNL